MIKVLFICIYNNARSQIAEELLRKYGGNDFEVHSAGIEPREINPLVIQVLNEDENIDISKKQTYSVMDFYKFGHTFHYVITVCDESQSQRCPIFPGVTHRLYWAFENPAELKGTTQENLQKIKEIKEDIKKSVIYFIQYAKTDHSKQKLLDEWKIIETICSQKRSIVMKTSLEEIFDKEQFEFDEENHVYTYIAKGSNYEITSKIIKIARVLEENGIDYWITDYNKISLKEIE